MTDNHIPKNNPPGDSDERTRATDIGQTRHLQPPSPQSSQSALPPQPPAVPRRHPMPPPARRGKGHSRRDSGLYFPLWSIVLMLFFVTTTAAGIVLIVLSLGGESPPDANPIVIIYSPQPTQPSGAYPLSPATATLPPDAQSLLNRPPVTFVLAGPTLPTPIISPTPQRINLGGHILVVGVGVQQLNVRNNPGVIGTSIVFRAEENTRFTVVDGPQQSDGLTWWKIQDPANAARTGWAASNYLQPTP